MQESKTMSTAQTILKAVAFVVIACIFIVSFAYLLSSLSGMTQEENRIRKACGHNYYWQDKRTDICFSSSPPHGYTYVPCTPKVLKAIARCKKEKNKNE